MLFVQKVFAHPNGSHVRANSAGGVAAARANITAAQQSGRIDARQAANARRRVTRRANNGTMPNGRIRRNVANMGQ